MSGMEDVKDHHDGEFTEEPQKSVPSSQEEEAAIKKKYGGIVPKKPPLISKDHERAYFDSADWALGKQGVEKPKGPLEALRPKLQEEASTDKKLHGQLVVSTRGTKKDGFAWDCMYPRDAMPTQQQTRYRKSPYAPADGEDGGSTHGEETQNE
ncbi:Endosulphine [Dillenia turbinata]|uniref:Endosulphine n=1 Tax=Dillenia turbinata TaxID=194707 RepID=A0AAN8UMU1_9MAGN